MSKTKNKLHQSFVENWMHRHRTFVLGAALTVIASMASTSHGQLTDATYGNEASKSPVKSDEPTINLDKSDWFIDLAQARAAAKESDKPMMIVFR